MTGPNNGNVVLTGEIDLAACAANSLWPWDRRPTGGSGPSGRALLQDDFHRRYRRNTNGGWQDYQKSCLHLNRFVGRREPVLSDQHRGDGGSDGKSLAGAVAGLAAPWGLEVGDKIA